MDSRLSELTRWVEQVFQNEARPLSTQWSCKVVSGDASFRRYFRVSDAGRSWIAVDAPPEKEDSRPFVEVAEAWLPLSVSVPDIMATDLERGFMLLEDFGDLQYLAELTPQSADQLYSLALDELVKIQGCRSLNGRDLPPYDQAMLMREMMLFCDWFLQQLLGLELSPKEQAALEQLFHALAVSALAQPQVCVHRDFHSRNLMLCEDGRTGVIDFQDAVMGPVTYDLVSLLRDCYISWPDDDVERWVAAFVERLKQRPSMQAIESNQFKTWFDLMGMQRHLKAVGIFARLNIRDGKAAYLQDIPRTFTYLIKVGGQYPAFQPVVAWFEAVVVPAMVQSELFDNAQMQRWLKP
ncbi:MAG: aminoglycoside phosphotransferase family protein [Pontibacterium sp.]